MSNETFEARLLKEHTPDPLEGHSVVVFERMGESGEKFHSVLAPGTPLARRGILRSMLGPRVNYFAFAVPASPELFLDFSHHVVMSGHAHEIDLLFTLFYSVEDPRLLATNRASDPLAMVRGKIARVIGGQIAQFEWVEVWDAFRARADTVVHDNLRSLRTFASQYGIAIRAVEVGLQLPEDETQMVRKVERGKTDVKLETELTLAQLTERERIAKERKDVDYRLHQHVIGNTLAGAEVEDQALALQRQRRVQDAAADAAAQGWTNIGAGITSVDEMAEVHETTHRSMREISGGGEAPGRIGHGGNGADPSRALPPGGLGGVVSDLVAATAGVHPSITRNALRGAVLHLVAEVVSDAAGDAGRQEEYARIARKLVAGLNPTPGSAVLDTLHTLIDPTAVNRLLNS